MSIALYATVASIKCQYILIGKNHFRSLRELNPVSSRYHSFSFLHETHHHSFISIVIKLDGCHRMPINTTDLQITTLHTKRRLQNESVGLKPRPRSCGAPTGILQKNAAKCKTADARVIQAISK